MPRQPSNGLFSQRGAAGSLEFMKPAIQYPSLPPSVLSSISLDGENHLHQHARRPSASAGALENRLPSLTFHHYLGAVRRLWPRSRLRRLLSVKFASPDVVAMFCSRFVALPSRAFGTDGQAVSRGALLHIFLRLTISGLHETVEEPWSFVHGAPSHSRLHGHLLIELPVILANFPRYSG